MLSKQRQTFDSWRLSRIAEEVDALSFSSTDDGTSTPASCGSRDNTLERRLGSQHSAKQLPTLVGLESLKIKALDDSYFNSRSATGLDQFTNNFTVESSYNSSTGYDSLRVKPNDVTFLNSISGYCNPREIVSGGSSASPKTDSSHQQERDALRFIKEKYDSLGKVKVQKPQSPAEPAGKHLNTVVNFSPKYSGDIIIDTGTPFSLNMSPGLRSVDMVGIEGQGRSDPGTSPDQRSIHLTPRSSSTPRIKLPPASPRFHAPLVRQSDAGCDGSLTSSAMRSTTSLDDVKRERCDVTRHELVQVELFYSSHKTTISVCPCVASMHVGTSKSLRALPSPVPSSRRSHGDKATADVGRLSGRTDWTFFKKGIPLLVLDSGEGRRRRRLHVVLAEKGTGFTLWRDTIDSQSQYTARAVNFHTMSISTDRSRLAGFLFDDDDDATEFHRNFHRLAIECERSVTNSSRESRKKSKTSETKKLKKASIDKAAISQPCCFTHITKLAGKERCGILQSVQYPTGSAESQSLKLLQNDKRLNDKLRKTN